eukprot:CAMPEP_0195063982 /NCGR_PEP_ID=MMETSP0448-20130528/10220_1 /TAXON_ID=66468 /ORGANISM="Heterocapsa triquestra, Strain CCMP 448" /LENGTH=57 /DNA_ID=CAMNT_0040094961 /DNA_START=58 /DNA_END=228 /DNA_ORIENTATION=+
MLAVLRVRCVPGEERYGTALNQGAHVALAQCSDLHGSGQDLDALLGGVVCAAPPSSG